MSEQTRPNLLLITTDQQRHDTIRAGGSPHVRTPHLDWLCDTGVRFANCYCDSPVCVTSRSTLITGRHFYNQKPFGWWGKDTAPDVRTTLPALLTAAGYQTRAVGKMHYTPARSNWGWEHVEILQDYYRHMARHPEKGVPMDHGLGQNEMEPGLSTVAEEHSLTRWTVDRSLDFLETRDPRRPFCLYTSFSKPHPPFDPCASYWEMYRNATVPEPVYGDWSRDPEAIPAGFLEPTWAGSGVDRFPPDLLRDARRAYYALITQIDYNLGYLFARMRELELLENTLILFTSDHGEMLGDHHMGGKSVFLGPSSRVPLLVRPPKGMLDDRRGTVCDARATLADVMPTFLAAAGAAAPSGQTLDGGDLLALASDKASAPRRPFFGEYGGQHCVMDADGRLKYLYADAGGGELLFDLSDDPQETRDLVRAGTHEADRRRLRGMLARHLAERGHAAATEGGDDLRPTRPAPTRREVRARVWPGFHTRHELSDVTH